MQSRTHLQRRHFACGLPTLYVFVYHRMSTSVDPTNHVEDDRNVRSMLSPASALRSALHHQKRWHYGHLLHACDQSHLGSDSSLRYFHSRQAPMIHWEPQGDGSARRRHRERAWPTSDHEIGAVHQQDLDLQTANVVPSMWTECAANHRSFLRSET